MTLFDQASFYLSLPMRRGQLALRPRTWVKVVTFARRETDVVREAIRGSFALVVVGPGDYVEKTYGFRPQEPAFLHCSSFARIDPPC